MGKGRVNPWMTLCEYLGVQYLAQKFLGGALRVSPAAMFCPHWGLNQHLHVSAQSLQTVVIVVSVDVDV